MRLFGHPMHVMLVHFPVALWPAHAVLHLMSERLPTGVAAVAGFWLLTAGVGLGWIAALCGAADVIELWRNDLERELNTALVHGTINGAVLVAFTGLLAAEYLAYPQIVHGGGFLAFELAVLLSMGVGNYFGAEIIWSKTPRAPRPQAQR